jgi:hypothetical protein
MFRKVLAGLLIVATAAVLLEGLAAAWLRFRPTTDDGRPRHRPIAIDPSVGYGYDHRDYLESPNTMDAVGPSRLYTLRHYGTPEGDGGTPLTILALGGSTTDPILQVKYSGTGGDWPHRLGQRLAAAGRSVSIANAAMVGNLAAQELSRLVAVLPESGADVVISLGGINEIYFNRCAPKFLLDALGELSSGGSLHHGDLSLRSASPLHRLHGTAIERLVRELRRGPRHGGEDVMTGERASGESLRASFELSDERRALLEKAADAWLIHNRMMQAICREFGVRHLVVLQPAMGVTATRESLVAAWQASVDAGSPDPVLHALLARKGALESLAYLYAALREHGRSIEGFHDASLPAIMPDTAEYWHSPRYPNAKGNARVAEVIEKLL